ncbi:MAG: hypothetical protein NWQ46_11105 [Spirosomaceae bacterium]|nr:hypothetical protein [Spirosomataceae bacterium]MDP5139503.1 hypothetical protein [Spirosomataceae bacterium]
MKILTATVLLFLNFACSDKIVKPTMNEAFTVKLKQSVALENDLSVKFADVQESRCPEGVQCIRAGELFATVELTDKGISKAVKFCISGECIDKKLNYGSEINYSGDAISVGSSDYRVEVIDFTPKINTQSTSMDEYSLILKIGK